jgi:hypothetical protein
MYVIRHVVDNDHRRLFPFSRGPESPTDLYTHRPVRYQLVFLAMVNPRTITQLVSALPEEAQRATVYHGKTLGKLLEAGEVSCITKLTNVACASGEPKAAHWTLARKVHYALVAGGLDARRTGITPKRFTLRSASPGTQSKRARRQEDQGTDASQGTLDTLFRRDDSDGPSGEGDESDDAEAGDGGAAVSASDEGSDGEKDGAPAESGAERDAGAEDEEAGIPPEVDGSSSSSSESDAAPIKRRRLLKPKSPVKAKMFSRVRAAEAAAAKEVAVGSHREATWLASIKALTSQVAGLSRYVTSQGDSLRASEAALAQLSGKMLAVERLSAASAAEAAKTPERVAEMLAQKYAAEREKADKAAALKAASLKATADKAAADKAAADKAAADKAAADKVAADKVAIAKAAADKVAADKVAADKVAADKVAADKVAADKAVSAKRASAEKSVADAATGAAGATPDTGGGQAANPMGVSALGSTQGNATPSSTTPGQTETQAIASGGASSATVSVSDGDMQVRYIYR